MRISRLLSDLAQSLCRRDRFRVELDLDYRGLAVAGSDKSKILQTIIYLSDMSTFGEMNAVWEGWIDPANPPARATSQAALATPDYKVEFIVTAAL